MKKSGNKIILAVDIGNTNINFGEFGGSKLINKFILSTRGFSIGQLNKKLREVNISETIICSVVPKITPKLEVCFRKSGIKCRVVGKNVRVPIINRYRKPWQVGQDRLVNAYAGIKLFGAPVVVVDFGTAITFDVVSKRREYLGGMILPGLRISLDALKRKTALLPAVNPAKPEEFIGRDTRNSMLSGIVYGAAGITDSFIFRLRNILGKELKVVATGGDAGLIACYCASVKKVDPDLTLRGLFYTFLGM